MRRILKFYAKPYSFLIIAFFFALLFLHSVFQLQRERAISLREQIEDLKSDISSLSVNSSPITPKDRITFNKDLIVLERELISLNNKSDEFLIQALGGAFFFVTAFFSWRNLIAAQEKQITERFSKAIEQLGSESLSVRLGGIYSLERIAKDSSKDYVTVMDILTTFVQEKSPISSEFEKVKNDIQAVLYAINQRNASQEPANLGFTLDFTNLREANFLRGDFRRFGFKASNLNGADLSQADFSETDLTEAKLNQANLRGTNFLKAIIRGADFREAKGLDPSQIKKAYDWETAIYDEEFRMLLGL